MGYRDRDYLKDAEGNILRVVGDAHPNSGVISFVKYYPKSDGIRTIGGKKYGYNTFLNKSLSILNEKSDRIIVSEQLGVPVSYTPNKLIVEYYSCNEKAKEILRCADSYSEHSVGKHLVSFLKEVLHRNILDYVGVTGSFLFDAYNDHSDIDLVCYGLKAYTVLTDLFNETDLIHKYEDGLREILINRRMEHMQYIDADTLMIQESRKLQGRIRNTQIHINCTPLRENHNVYQNFAILHLGDISCVAQIIDDSNGIYSPTIYGIKIKTVIRSSLPDLRLVNKHLYLISYNGDYSQVFRNNDNIYIDGKIVRIITNGNAYLGVDITPWSIGSKNQAVLLCLGEN